MTESIRDDFFTLIHKGLRRELFALTTLAATSDGGNKCCPGEAVDSVLPSIR